MTTAKGRPRDVRVGSLFTGVGGFDLGLERAGMRVVWQCEADPWRRRVLQRHWPGVPCYDDVVHLRESAGRGSADPVCPTANGRRREAGAGLPRRVDLICGGFPCQDLSVAGRRAGLQGGERSSLFFECARVADAVLPDGGWLLIENVPGLLSSHDGRDFAVLLATLAELGFHDLAWRVLDSRYFGVPQRRRRVYILGRRASGRLSSEVLLEPESGGGDFAAGGEARAGAARGTGDGVAGTVRSHQRPGSNQFDVVNAHRRRGGADDNEAQGNQLVSVTGKCVTTGHGQRLDYDTDRFVSAPADPNRVRTSPGVSGRLDGDPVSAFHATQDPITSQGYAPSLGGNAYLGVNGHGEPTAAVPFDPRPDGPRYAACGDAVTVNVAQWIGERIMAAVEADRAA